MAEYVASRARPMRTRAALVLLALGTTAALKEHDFRKCKDTPFCQLHRSPPTAGYEVDASGVSHEKDGVLSAKVASSESLLPLKLTVTVLKSGAVRVHLDEDPSLPLAELDKPDPAVRKPEEWDDDMDGDWIAPRITVGRAVKTRFNSEASFASADVVSPAGGCEHAMFASTAEASTLSCFPALAPGKVEVEVRHAPLAVAVLLGGEKVAVLNGRSLLRFEHFKQNKGSDVAEGSEKVSHTFGSFTDTMPFGSSSVGVDVVFPRATHSYGLPERTVAHALPPTLGKEPYRLFNLDVFEYLLDHPMTVYGSVPFLHAHGDAGSYGALWLNPAETFVDMGCPEGEAAATGVCSHWFGASGMVDVFLFAGASPTEVTRQHAALTGVTPLPPLFALGYHQCRWNYKDEEDVSTVHARFDEEELPLDVLWLDIEHTDRKRYFTWNEDLFPDPVRMQKELARTGRKMVTIIDPHLRAEDDFPVFAKAKELQLLVRTADNSSHFEGDCWPGRSGWVDYLQPAAREYWASRFTADNYKGSTETLYTWNDMNEPSVFDGPEITMPPMLLHHDGSGGFFEHRELHNMYGMLMHMATHAGQTAAYPSRRPFVLTRAFFAGSQRYAGVWTGDNKASWAHLAATTSMLLALSVAGVPFVGADVGGFFGNPTTALLVRWYQTAVFHPFLRAHAEFKTKRREPYLFGEDVTRQVREALRLRYSLLPYLYTLFADHARTGDLVLRPLWHEFPADAAVRGEPWWSPEPVAKTESAEATSDDAEAEDFVAAKVAAEQGRVLSDADADADADVAAATDSADSPRECMCYKCDDSPCYAPECSSCGQKDSSGCKMVNGVAYPPWGCYRYEQEPCKCQKKDKYEDDDDYRRYDAAGYRGDDGEEDYDAEPPEEVGECPCHWCSGKRCYAGECATCGTKETSGCIKEDGTTSEWGCYTTADAECECNANPAPVDKYKDSSADKYKDTYRDEHEDDEELDDKDRYGTDDHDDDDDDDDSSGGASTDYNQEYYHGDAGDNDQDEAQPQTAEQFMLGPSVLVQPVTAMHCTTTNVYLPATSEDATAIWYDLHTHEAHLSKPGQRVLEDFAVHADRVPAFVRGGAVLPKRERPRRASSSTHTDPFTLEVAPDADGVALGTLYLDEYDGYGYEQGAQGHHGLVVRFELTAGVLKGGVFDREGASAPAAARSKVERVRFLGQPALRKVTVRGPGGAEVAGVVVQHDPESATLTVRQPGFSVVDDWVVELGAEVPAAVA